MVLDSGRCLLYYLHDEPARLRFTLVDPLEPQELADLKASWRTAESTRRDRALVVDVRRLREIAGETQGLIEAMRNAGARIVGKEDADKTRRGLLRLGLVLVAAACRRAYALGSEFWNKKDPSEWTSDEIRQLTTKSPWAREATIERPRAGGPRMRPGGRMGRGRARPGGAQYKAIVRWESAAPVLAALKKPLPPGLAGHYAISVSGMPAGGNMRSEDMLDHLKAFTELQAKGRPGIQPGIVQRERGTRTLLFGFSRDLLPLGAGDKEVTFSMHVGQVTLKARFDPKDMRYRGQMAL